MSNKSFFSTLICFAVLSVAAPAFAFYTVQDTGDLLAPNQTAIGAAMQWITDGPVDGVNVLGHVDKGLNNSSNLRFEAGTGATDAVLGGYVKWVPFPDYQNQPAVGFSMGAQYAHFEGASEIAARVTPIASKRFNINTDSWNAVITPYVAVPIAVATYNNGTLVPIQLTMGAKYHDPRIKQCDFLAELDFDVNQAPNAIVFGAEFSPF